MILSGSGMTGANAYIGNRIVRLGAGADSAGFRQTAGREQRLQRRRARKLRAEIDNSVADDGAVACAPVMRHKGSDFHVHRLLICAAQMAAASGFQVGLRPGGAEHVAIRPHDHALDAVGVEPFIENRTRVGEDRDVFLT